MANRLKEIRMKKGLTQAELSEKSGISRVTISGLENGEIGETKTGTLVKLADALETTVTALFFADEV